MLSHYSKSQTFVQKFNFDKSPTFSRVFHPNFFWQFFSWNQSCQQLKSSKLQHFHEFFTQKNRQFSREIKVEFLDKKWRFRTVCTLLLGLTRRFFDIFTIGGYTGFRLGRCSRSWRSRRLSRRRYWWWWGLGLFSTCRLFLFWTLFFVVAFTFAWTFTFSIGFLGSDNSNRIVYFTFGPKMFSCHIWKDQTCAQGSQFFFRYIQRQDFPFVCQFLLLQQV